jgi:hypothetical protein
MKFLSSFADIVKAKQSSLKSSTRSIPRSSVPMEAGGAAETPQDCSGPTSSVQRPLRLGTFDFEGTNFPDLFHEANDMLNLSNLIYVLAEVREMARGGLIGDSTISSRALELPLRLEDVAGIFVSEADVLREKYGDGKHAAVMGAIESLLGRQEAALRAAALAAEDAVVVAAPPAPDGAGVLGWITSWCGGGTPAPTGGDGDDVDGKEEPGTSAIAAMGDSRSNEELVYAVGLNPLEGRITVIFRGSVTRADFVTDSRIALVRAPDPRRFYNVEGDDPGGDVGVHQGFHEYLMGERDGRPSKYEEIVSIVERLLAEAPAGAGGGYKLYVTGHSLGGALATLFGFYASASPSIPAPVTVVSVASPRVGNVEFARAFVELESQGRVRHLRIANHKDPVTLGPTVSAKRGLALSAKAVSPLGYLALLVTGNGEGGEEEVYYHTGMKMKLLRNASPETNRRCELSYNGATILGGAKKPADTDIDADDLADIEQAKKAKKSGKSTSELPMVQYHYGDAYAERMASLEPDLEGLTLNDLYRSKARGFL